MLKKLSCIAIIVLPLFAQYSFDFTCTNDTFQIVNPWEVAKFFFRLENTGTELDIYELYCDIIDDVPSSWYVTWCIGGS
ncbi:hypothetical protein AMJ52_04960 [candidate division TA06 bacterium DG_78]|uniref:Uncharacterized protein n=1 Tax=candidate division TA06 bacterium DG_78 TaxID=1703772 RepID=A0A0S7YDV4_UNCT6|nr:MAG: hypothetical protein AMJ52_04960 [candidate division TA06 bacterium DG_78]